MGLRPLVIDDVAKDKAAKIEAYARAHPVIFKGCDTEVPGLNPNHWAWFNSYRAVFSYTKVDPPRGPAIFRHLSVSVAQGKRGALPNPVAVWALADLFGFTGWDGRSEALPDTWMADHHTEPVDHIVVIQRMEKAN
jgi:hypothetical protein